MKIVAFGASSSTKSINKKFATFTASLFEGAEVKTLDLNDYEMPIYSEDREGENGIPELAKKFFNEFTDTDLIIISFAEHNGTYTAAFKNILDWASRIDKELFQKTKTLILSTSPGPGGASSVLNQAVNSFQFFGGEVVGSYSLPSFYDNFDVETNALKSQDHLKELKEVLAALK